MTRRPFTLGAVALACACGTALAKSPVTPSNQILDGLPRLACEAILCLSSSLRPSECTPSLNHYFGIQIFNKYGLDWGATVAARRVFLGMCPAATAPGMPARLDAISQGAGKCDPDSLNSVFAATSYRYRTTTQGSGDAGEQVSYDVYPVKTVQQNTLPGYCVTYNDHVWTYDLGVKYVGEPLKGGYWIKAKDFSAAQARWNAEHTGQWAEGWSYAWQDPRHAAENRHGE